MHKLFVIGSVVLLHFLTCCIEVKFTESQPKGVDDLIAFPEELRGTFVNQDGDTLIVTLNKLFLFNRKSKCNSLIEEDSLSRYLKLKTWENYYFISYNEDSLWSVGLIRKLPEGDILLLLIDAESDSILNRIASVTEIDTMFYDVEPELYIVNPTAKELKEMVDTDAFSIQYHFVKISN